MWPGVSVTETYVDAPPEAVFDVLADPGSYAHWVVGATRTRCADHSWPRPGSRFHHTQGLFGIGLPDNTQVVASNRPRQLVLHTRIRPFAVNKVELRLRRRGRGTRVTMIEYPVGGIAEKISNPVMNLLLHVRNVESLRRLRRMAEDGRERN
jgi:uncharacterized protein YndB with AHSA1/START domain